MTEKKSETKSEDSCLLVYTTATKGELASYTPHKRNKNHKFSPTFLVLFSLFTRKSVTLPTDKPYTHLCIHAMHILYSAVNMQENMFVVWCMYTGSAVLSK